MLGEQYNLNSLALTVGVSSVIEAHGPLKLFFFQFSDFLVIALRRQEGN